MTEVSVVCERDREINTNCYVDLLLLLLLSIPLCFVFKALRLLFRRNVINNSSPGGHLALCGHGSLSAETTPLQSGTDSRLTVTETFIWASVHIISYHPRFSINHVPSSIYLLRRVLIREISD